MKKVLIASPIRVHPWESCRANGRFIRPFSAVPATRMLTI